MLVRAHVTTSRRPLECSSSDVLSAAATHSGHQLQTERRPLSQVKAVPHASSAVRLLVSNRSTHLHYIAQITSRVCMNTNHIHAQLIPALLEQRRVVHTRQAPQTAAGPVLAPTDILCAGGAERLGIVAEAAPLGGRELEGKA